MQTTLIPIAELAAAHAATLPFANEEETRPVSWRPAGSPGDSLWSYNHITFSDIYNLF